MGQRRSHIIEAFDFEPCEECGTYAGDPCRTPGGKTREPHAGRRQGEPARVITQTETPRSTP